MVRPEKPGQFRAKAIIFGDDYMGTVLDERAPYKNSKGVWMKKYLIIPSPQLIGAYSELQQPDALTYNGYAIWVEYPVKWICDENNSRNWSVARVDCTFDGDETPHTRRYESYTKEIKLLEEENESLNIANLQLLEQYKQSLGDVKEIHRALQEIEEIRGVKNEGPDDYEED